MFEKHSSDSSSFSRPKLLEVCTRPGMSADISSTLSGRASSAAQTSLVSAAVRALTVCTLRHFASTAMFGSVLAYSPAYCAARAQTSSHSIFGLSVTTLALETGAIAVSLTPPSRESRRKCVLSSLRSRAIRTFALARPLSISTPECPLTSPDIEISTTVPVALSLLTGMLLRAFTPPAQLHIRTPSYSESRFISLCPLS